MFSKTHAMKPTLLIVSLSIIVFSACSNSSSVSENAIEDGSTGVLKVINVADAKEFDGFFNELVEDIYYLKLDTQQDALFSELTKLIVLEDRIIVFDRAGKRIVVFDEKGNFRFRILNPGDGPGEYKDLETISYDRENGQFILAAYGKLLWYDGDGRFLKEVKTMNAIAGDIASLPNGNLAAYYDMRGVYAAEDKIRAAVLNEQADFVNTYQPLPKNVRTENITGLNSHFSISKYPLAVGVYSHDMLRFKDDSAFVEYSVDFGSDALPDAFIETYITDPAYTPDEVRKIIAEKGYWSIYGGAPQETNDYLIFNFSNWKDYSYALYNKKTESVLSIDASLKESSGSKSYLYFQSAFKDYFITKNGSRFVQNLYADLKDETEQDELLEALENEVPVLWFIKFKSQME